LFDESLPRRYRKTDVFLKIADDLSHLGTCDRAKVGALIVKDGRCISWGYNGAPPGLPHCDENGHGWVDGVRYTSWHNDVAQEIQEHGCRNATHAEANAIAYAARQGISTDGATLYITVSPCGTCARLLIAAGIREVVYQSPHRDWSGVEILRKAEVKVLLA
jgi:dCMP deaminase